VGGGVLEVVAGEWSVGGGVLGLFFGAGVAVSFVGGMSGGGVEPEPALDDPVPGVSVTFLIVVSVGVGVGGGGGGWGRLGLGAPGGGGGGSSSVGAVGAFGEVDEPG